MIQLLPFPQAATLAQEREGCFLVNSVGEIVNLNDLCSSEPESVTITGNDEKFVEAYKRLAKRYSQTTTDYLLAQIQTSVANKIAAAKQICLATKSGVSLEEWKLKALTQAEKIDSPTVKEGFLADMDIIVTLAPNIYCPEAANQ